MFLQTCKKLKFPNDSLPVLENAYQAIIANPKALYLLQEACESMLTPNCNKFSEIMPKIAEITGVHQHTADMVLLLYAIEPLKKIYAQNGFPEELMWESMEDLRYKLLECKAVHNVWGTFVTPWFKGFYVLRLFKLGRLEYEALPCAQSLPYDGDTMVMLHIPSSGPLLLEDVMDSLKRAYAFYKDRFSDGIVRFVTHSWLIYPPHVEHVFPKKSNLQKFASLFRIVSTDIQENNYDFWRVFNCSYDEDNLDNAPQDTVLQRNLLAYLKQGNKMGNGFGLILYRENGIID